MVAMAVDGSGTVRSSACERRLRKRRQEARTRVQLAADAALLAGHHASALPGCMRPQHLAVQTEVEALRAEVNALRALVELFEQRLDASKPQEEEHPKGVVSAPVVEGRVPHVVLDDVSLDRKRMSVAREKDTRAADVGSAAAEQRGEQACPSTYSISFSTSAGRTKRWGVRLLPRDGLLVIRHVDEGGLIAAWNAANAMDPSAPVRSGDSIISVNDAVGEHAIDEQILNAAEWRVTFARDAGFCAGLVSP